MPDETLRMHRAIPILRVNDLAASVAYYTKALGFKVDWDAGGFCSVTRSKCTLFLCEGGQGHAGTWMWAPVEDADRLHEEFVANGAKILTAPANYSWGSRELHVIDRRHQAPAVERHMNVTGG